jgi:hypothetical protein
MLTATATTTGTPSTEWVNSLLAAEGASGTSDNGGETAMAAGRVYAKLHAQLVPLLGAPGVRALFARSATLARRRGGDLCEAAQSANGMSLRAGLRAIEPAIAETASERLFATFIGLMPTFIGERLTRDALNRAWPHLAQQPQ